MQQKQSKVHSVKRRSKVRSVKRRSKVRSVKRQSTKKPSTKKVKMNVHLEEYSRIAWLYRNKAFGKVLNSKYKIKGLNAKDYNNGYSISYDNTIFMVRTNEKGIKKFYHVIFKLGDLSFKNRAPYRNFYKNKEYIRIIAKINKPQYFLELI